MPTMTVSMTVPTIPAMLTPPATPADSRACLCAARLALADATAAHHPAARLAYLAAHAERCRCRHSRILAVVRSGRVRNAG